MTTHSPKLLNKYEKFENLNKVTKRPRVKIDCVQVDIWIKPFVSGRYCLAQVAKTGFSHRLTAYKILGHFFGLSYLNISGNNQVEESVACQSHAPLLRSEVAQSSKSYGHFSDLRVEIALSRRHVEFFE